MKQFLRFQISGTTCFFWLFLFIIPYFNFSLITTTLDDLIKILLGIIILASPIGIIIHQISISLLSPFRKHRFFNIRKSYDLLKKTDGCLNNSDKKNQSVLVYAKSIEYSRQTKAGISIKYNTSCLQSEIENRYSYYYVRIDNGLFSPAFAYLFFLLIKGMIPNIFFSTPIIPWWIVPLSAIIVCILMLMYVPILLREVDDLEILLLNNINAIEKLFTDDSQLSVDVKQSNKQSSQNKNLSTTLL